jgi:hypothetical protein
VRFIYLAPIHCKPESSTQYDFYALARDRQRPSPPPPSPSRCCSASGCWSSLALSLVPAAARGRVDGCPRHDCSGACTGCPRTTWAARSIAARPRSRTQVASRRRRRSSHSMVSASDLCPSSLVISPGKARRPPWGAASTARHTGIHRVPARAPPRHCHPAQCWHPDSPLVDLRQRLLVGRRRCLVGRRGWDDGERAHERRRLLRRRGYCGVRPRRWARVVERVVRVLLLTPATAATPRSPRRYHTAVLGVDARRGHGDGPHREPGAVAERHPCWRRRSARSAPCRPA